MPPTIEGVTHRVINVGELAVHIAEAGSGPLVLMLHGFPAYWYSWRPANGASDLATLSLSQCGCGRRGPPLSR
jgi:pimeloyl-ACP methyl ester carboxylesterase